MLFQVPEYHGYAPNPLKITATTKIAQVFIIHNKTFSRMFLENIHAQILNGVPRLDLTG